MGARSAHGLRIAAATTAIALVVVAAAFATPLWRAGAFLPEWITWSHADLSTDLDGDGETEDVTLSGRRVSVFDDGSLACQTSPDWLVSDAFVGDVTHDGAPELVAITWKRGSFGTARPFWIDRDDAGFSQHVFVFNYEDGELKQTWMSSALGFEVHAARLDDAGLLRITDESGNATAWEWRSWGFALAEESAERPAGNGGDGSSDSTGASPTDNADAAQTLSLLAVGDAIPHDSMLRDARLPGEQGYDFTPTFAHVTDEIERYDIAVVNEETPIVDDPQRYAGYPLFGTPAAWGDALASAGFDIVLGASNHAYDQGDRGVSDTIEFWRARHPEVSLLGLHDAPGADTCTSVERNGIRLALFNATYGLNGDALAADRAYEIDTLDDDGARLAEQVAAAEENADMTVCFLHVGDEYATEPSRWQRALCERLIDAGADAIICSHPHILQPAELLRTDAGSEGVVFWSLGNFVSNQLDPETALGGAASLTIEKDASGTRVSSWRLGASVCHFEPGSTCVYWLDDYTDDLAQRHYINTFGNPSAITLSKLRFQLNEVY